MSEENNEEILASVDLINFEITAEGLRAAREVDRINYQAIFEESLEDVIEFLEFEPEEDPLDQMTYLAAIDSVKLEVIDELLSMYPSLDKVVFEIDNLQMSEKGSTYRYVATALKEVPFFPSHISSKTLKEYKNVGYKLTQSDSKMEPLSLPLVKQCGCDVHILIKAETERLKPLYPGVVTFEVKIVRISDSKNTPLRADIWPLYFQKNHPS